jgi:acetyl-CoA decarbonylase/synthase complex subunit gamma
MERLIMGDAAGDPRTETRRWRTGWLNTPAGHVPVVSTSLTAADRAGHWRVRCGIGRHRYRVPPGLYAIGSPTARSQVFVTANFKMSFDHLRSRLRHYDAWILVLDTRGINVWCAAGKGTFGTEELIRRINDVRLGEIVSHRRLILPQLGATGVSAPRVEEECGWRVVFGPVRAEDLPAFLEAGLRATPTMRRVFFPLRDRVTLVPVELVGTLKYVAVAAVCLLLLAGLGSDGYSLTRLSETGPRSVAMLVLAALAGAAVVPTLLPWLPGRAFASKGLWVGIALVLCLHGWQAAGHRLFDDWMEAMAWSLLIPAISSFLALNFTGASTFTSLSGVRREMRVAVPAQTLAAVAGSLLWLTGRFV